MAMTELGNGLFAAQHYEDAVSVQEAELSIERRQGASEQVILCVQGNIARTYEFLGREQQALDLRRDVYSRRLKLSGEEHKSTLRAANNFASSLADQQHFEEAKSLLRKTMRVARRVLGESHDITLLMRWNYAAALCADTGATLDDLREAAKTLEEAERIARRVLGGAHPTTAGIERALRGARAELLARETPSGEAV